MFIDVLKKKKEDQNMDKKDGRKETPRKVKKQICLFCLNLHINT